jgi:aspartate racemase
VVKTIGVVGGMGPLATIEFLRHLVKSVSVENESDFPRIVSDINPNIPSRTRHVLFEGQDFVPAIADSAKNLQRLGAQFIVVPCNSAQYKLDKMRSSIELPVLSIFESVVNDLDARSMNVMVLGGPVTFQRESYREPIEKSGRSYFSPASRLQEMVEEIIYSTKIGKLI